MTEREVRFTQRFQTLTGHPPFPWQERLYGHFVQGDFPETCSLPTGLGKTSLIAIWLLALAENPLGVPRRLAYVVNRRTVVDQTTDEVRNLRENLPRCPDVHAALLGLCGIQDFNGEPVHPLAISTLRGQSADNQEWSIDPARPAVVCGTVDMIGSRLLFGGYRSGFRSRPLHAGFLGQDALLVHDEAHLEPAFQHLLERVVKEQRDFEPQRFGARHRLGVIGLTATARGQRETFRLDAADLEHDVVRQRMRATKQLALHALDNEKKGLVDAVVSRATEFADRGRAVLIFLRTVDAVEQVADKLRKQLKSTEHVCTLTGTMRGLERDKLVQTAVFQRFLPSSGASAEKVKVETKSVYLVCTSAGEVGVNISADDLICDLSTFDSMAQRFGRVNRFGIRGDTQIDVYHPVDFPTDDEVIAELAKPSDKQKGRVIVDQRRQRTLQLLHELHGDASPQRLSELPTERCWAAFAPDPEMVEATDILFDAWSLTTITEELPGRPSLTDFLHGIASWEPPVTEVAWREEVSVLTESVLAKNQFTHRQVLDSFPVKPHEILRDRTDRVLKHLETMASREEAVSKAAQDPEQTRPAAWQAWVIDPEQQVQVYELRQLVEKQGSRQRVDLSNCLVLLPPDVGGLDEGGMLNGSSSTSANDVSTEWFTDDARLVKRRDRRRGDEEPPSGMRRILSINLVDIDDREEDEDSEVLATKRIWHWYERPALADDAGLRSSDRAPILFPGHTNQVVENMRLIADKLLAEHPQLHAALMLAARGHDLGKRRVIWQRSIGNPRPAEWYEKSGVAEESTAGEKWGQLIELTRYRHEFGSLFDLRSEESLHAEFEQLTPEMQDVVLHAIATHHGYARPHFPVDRAFDPHQPETDCEFMAAEIPRRFARLQRRYGRWGLAWLESLFRAADQSASAHPAPVAETQEVLT